MKNKKRVNNADPILWYGAGQLVRLYLHLKYNYKFDGAKIKKHSIILALHRSYYDCVLIPAGIYPTQVHIVSTTLWFRNKFLGSLFTALATIPKQQFKNDVNSVFMMAEVLKRNENILIFPEGQMSLYGDSLKLPQGLDKLIYKFKPNVYFIDTEGAYLSSPRWNPNFEKGFFRGHTIELFSDDRPEEYTIENINNKINECFKNSDDFNTLHNPDFKIKKKDIANGIENILHFCPKCESLLPFIREGNKITCGNCGYSLEFMDQTYFFKDQKDFKHLGELFKYERAKWNEYVNTKGFRLENEVHVTWYDEEYNKHDNGIYTLKLENDIVTLTNGEHTISLEASKIINIVMNFKRGIELPTDEATYICDFLDPKNVCLWWSYINR